MLHITICYSIIYIDLTCLSCILLYLFKQLKPAFGSNLLFYYVFSATSSFISVFCLLSACIDIHESEWLWAYICFQSVWCVSNHVTLWLYFCCGPQLYGTCNHHLKSNTSMSKYQGSGTGIVCIAQSRGCQEYEIGINVHCTNNNQGKK